MAPPHPPTFQAADADGLLALDVPQTNGLIMGAREKEGAVHGDREGGDQVSGEERRGGTVMFSRSPCH